MFSWLSRISRMSEISRYLTDAPSRNAGALASEGRRRRIRADRSPTIRESGKAEQCRHPDTRCGLPDHPLLSDGPEKRQAAGARHCLPLPSQFR